MKIFFNKLKSAKKEIDKINSDTEEHIKNIKKEKEAFMRKTDEILKDDLNKLERLKEKMNCLSDENNLDDFDNTIDEIIAISQDDIGKRAQDELYFDSLKNVTEHKKNKL